MTFPQSQGGLGVRRRAAVARHVFVNVQCGTERITLQSCGASQHGGEVHGVASSIDIDDRRES